MKSVALTFCVLCFHFEALYGVESCSSKPCRNIDQPHISDPQVMVEFENGDFKFTFPHPKNVSEFSMTLVKGKEKKEICTFFLSEAKNLPKSNVTYCEVENSNSSTTFILKNLERKHIDIYTYCLEIFLPPPYIDCRLTETYLYIQVYTLSTVPTVSSLLENCDILLSAEYTFPRWRFTSGKSFSRDKEDCFSLGQESWIIIGLIMFALISCVCCVVACCLRNKNQTYDSNSHEYNSEYMPMAAVNAAKKPRI